MIATVILPLNPPLSLDCVYKGRVITNGTDYVSTGDCIKCRCSKGVMNCCSIGIRITSKPDDCKVVPDGPCSQKAVLIADETKPCPGGIGAVGR
ncbi:Hypothetical predicted protein [Mytilus galloprovincialis]|uniref:VWFC domain-containing protein n=1 Tax=Mytilus galloprovincialis TaxID=29158 RepID=A0A8B6G019_MYTGA|nr:Hypothetical predicted protein [Mytilus galloprovincialis]